MNHPSLEGRVILITGATGALGSVAAKACAQAGATVILLGRHIRKLEKLYDEIVSQGGRKPAIYPLDLAGASEQDYADLADTLRQELGGLYGLMHCAAELGHLMPLSEIDGTRWQRLLQVNLTAPFLLTRAVGKLLIENGRGAQITEVNLFPDLADFTSLSGKPATAVMATNPAGIGRLARVVSRVRSWVRNSRPALKLFRKFPLRP